MANNYHKFTPEQEQFIRDHAKGTYCKDLAELFNKEYNTNVTARQMENFKKRKRIFSGIDCKYKKGHVSANKGKHQETTGRMAETQFKKGQISANAVPIGTIHKLYNGYAIKVRDGHMNKNWMQLSHYVWEQTHGEKVPEGCRVLHLDKDKFNCDPDNLVVVSKKELLLVNGGEHKLGDNAEINQALVTIAKIRNAKYKRKKENGHK